MNKEQAAHYLGISVRTLQRITKAGKIPVTYERGHKGDEARYSQQDLDRYLQSEKPAALMRPNLQSLDGATNGATGDATQAMTLAATRGAGLQAQLSSLLSAMVQAASVTDLAHKLMLSIPEAAQLSGISAEKLRQAAHSGKLKTVKSIGRGLGKVKRADLEAYVKKL